jgi:N-methylhydantoinase A
LRPTVTDADLVLGYLDPANYAAGHIKLNPKRALRSMADLCDELDRSPIEVAKLIRQTVDANMANGIATELRTRGYEPKEFTILAYGGNGPLHACGIAEQLGVDRILAPPFSAVFSAVGAGNMKQMHIHEASAWTVLFDASTKSFFTRYQEFNANVALLEQRGREDLLRQGFRSEEICYRLELDMRYGNQRVQTAVVSTLNRLRSQGDVLSLIHQFHTRYGERYGEGSQSPEAGIRINTLRVCSYVEQSTVQFAALRDDGRPGSSLEPVGQRNCHFTTLAASVETRLYDERALIEGTRIDGPAIVTTRATTYLIEPGWRSYAAAQGAVWFTRAGH